MVTKVVESTGRQKEDVVSSASEENIQAVIPATVREAAIEAAETYGIDEIEKHAQAIMAAWESRLKEEIRLNSNLAMRRAREVREGKSGNGHVRGAQPEAAEPVGLPLGLPPYVWWDLILAGPFQPAPIALPPPPPFPGGPFLPQKIINAGEDAFMIAALVRNPVGINFDPFSPSAATMMSALNLNVTFQTVNLTTVTPGPVFLPAPPLPSPLNGGFLNLMFVPILAGSFPAPLQGNPHLYEVNMVADVSGPVAGIPFAGYATWILDPDLPVGLFLPDSTGLQADIPGRFLVYTA
jgi:hypothetical protein